MTYIQKVRPGAIPPVMATPGSAAHDFAVPYCSDPVVIRPQHRVMVGSGWAIEVPHGYGLFLFSRSGHGAKHGVRLANCVGVIDSDYRGEIIGAITNDGMDQIVLKPGDRYMQGVLMPIRSDEWVVTDVLSNTSRGEGGFGSTGG